MPGGQIGGLKKDHIASSVDSGQCQYTLYSALSHYIHIPIIHYQYHHVLFNTKTGAACSQPALECLVNATTCATTSCRFSGTLVI
jgi:hypothetical protein